MKISDVNNNSIKIISNKELLNMHWRIHELYINISKSKKILNIEYKKMLIKKHQIIVEEMIKRNMKHKTALIESYLNKFI